MPATDSATLGPPADMEYAEDPLGVHMIGPSACAIGCVVKNMRH